MSILVLFRHLYSDSQNREIDSRWNYYGLGIGVFACLLNNLAIWYVVFSILLFISSFFWRRIWAEGDYEVLRWIVPALVLFGLSAPFEFLLILFVLCFGERALTFYMKRSGKLKFTGLTAGIPHLLLALGIFYAFRLALGVNF